MDLIADTVASIYASKDEQHQDLIFDDKVILQSEIQEAATNTISDIKGASKRGEPANGIDELLEDDSQATDEDTIPKIKPEKVDEDGDY